MVRCYAHLLHNHLPHVKVLDSHERLALMIETSGAEVVREHGLLTGEVMGLGSLPRIK